MSQISPSTPSSRAGDPSQGKSGDRLNILAVIIIGLVSIGMGVVAGIFNPLLNRSTAAEGVQIDALFSVLLGIGTTVFFIVQGGLIYSIIRFRRRGEDDDDAEPTHGHTGLEIIWTAIPAGIVAGLTIFSYIILVNVERPTANAIVVEVTGRQFSWEFYYPDRDLRSNELRVPRGRQVHLKMRSADVIHAFWVPDFRIKKDLMPDRVTETWFTPRKTGTYPIVCAELCGAGHAVMRGNVIVEELASFEAWARKQTAPQVDTSDPIAYGRQLFTQYGCNACHALDDAQAAGQAGPPLNGIGNTAEGRQPGKNAEQYIHDSIVNPNEFIVPNYQPIMPQDYGQRMSDQELQAMVQYLLQQK